MALTLRELAGEDLVADAVRRSVANITDLDVLIDRFKALDAEVQRTTASITELESRPQDRTDVGATGGVLRDGRQDRLDRLHRQLRDLRTEATEVGRRLSEVASGAGTPAESDEPARVTTSPFRGTAEEVTALLGRISEVRVELQKAGIELALAPAGEAAEKAKEKVDELAASLVRLRGLAAGAVSLDGIGDRIGAPSLPTPGRFVRDRRSRAEIEAVEQKRAEAERRRAQGLFDPDQLRMSRTGVASERFRDDRKRAVEAQAEAMERASRVTVASLGSMAEAAIRGSGQMEVSVINAFTSILRSTEFGGGLFGTILGAVGGIAGALFSRDKNPVPVRVDDYSSTAERKMKNAGGGPTRITNIIETGGVEVERIEQELYDRQNRDEVVRFPRRR